MATSRPYVLVHGAFHGAWCWDPVTPALRAAGHAVDALDLPGRDAADAERGRLTLDDYAGVVAAALTAAPEPVILVGHSLGGIVITQAAELVPERVARLVYLAAFLPRDGEGVPQLISDSFRNQSLIPRHQEIDRRNRVSRFPPEAAAATFYSRTDPAVAAAATLRLVPEALGPQASPVHISAERAGSIPRAYIETLHDATIPLDTQREMQAAAGVDDVLTLDADHAPQLSAPDALATALLQLSS